MPQVRNFAEKIEAAFPGGVIAMQSDLGADEESERVSGMAKLDFGQAMSEVAARLKLLPGKELESQRCLVLGRLIALVQAGAKLALQCPPGASAQERKLTEDRQHLASEVRFLLKAVEEPLNKYKSNDQLLQVGQGETETEGLLTGLIDVEDARTFRRQLNSYVGQLVSCWMEDMKELVNLLASYIPSWRGVKDAILQEGNVQTFLALTTNPTGVSRLKNGTLIGEKWLEMLKAISGNGAGQVMLPSEQKQLSDQLADFRETTTFIFAATQLGVTIPSEQTAACRKTMVKTFRTEFRIGQKDQLMQLGRDLDERLVALASGATFSPITKPAEPQVLPTGEEEAQQDAPALPATA